MASRQARTRGDPEYVRCRICGAQRRNLFCHIYWHHRLSSAEYRERFGAGFLWSKDARARVSRAGRRKRRPGRYVPLDREEIVRELERHVDAGGSMSLTWFNAHRRSLARQAMDVFGSWTAARRAAGVAPGVRSWSRELVVAEIRRHRAAGHDLSYSGMTARDQGLTGAACAHLGSWRQAVEAAGIDYRGVRRVAPALRTKRSVGAALRGWSRTNGGVVPVDLQRGAGGLYQAVRKQYGSLRNACSTLRLPLREQTRRWSRDLVLRIVRRRRRRGQSLRSTVLEKEDPTLVIQGRSYFGSWPEALRAAGLDRERITRRRIRTPETIARDLRAWVQAHGPLSDTGLRHSDQALHLAAVRRYRTVGRAAAALGIPYRPRVRPWTRERIIEEIRARARAGKPLGRGSVQRDHSGLASTGRARFGSWPKALRAAGFVPAGREPGRGGAVRWVRARRGRRRK